MIAIFLFMGVVSWYSKKEDFTEFAKQLDSIPLRRFNVTCSSDFKNDLKKFKGNFQILQSSNLILHHYNIYYFVEANNFIFGHKGHLYWKISQTI